MVSLQRRTLESKPPVPQSETVFGERLFTKGIKLNEATRVGAKPI